MNPVTLTRTKFTNVKSGRETFGYCLYDESDQAYDNTMTERDMKLNDEDFFTLVCDRDFGGANSAMLNWALEHDIEIDGDHYSAQVLLDWRANS